MEQITFRNPVGPRGNDPWVIRDGDTYYYCYSKGTGVCVARLDSLTVLDHTNETVVYQAPEGTMWSKEYWAPELHKLNGTWYIYVAADDGDNCNHRMYVLRCTGDVPTDPFEMVDKISDSTDKWAIDGTVLSYQGQLWFVWSGWEGDENVSQNIYIAHMSDPCTIDGPRVLLSKPDLKWERRGGSPKINEGPVALIRGDTVHIVYSASGSWCDDYCLGLLTCRDGRFSEASSWEKASQPLLYQGEGAYGPGHCSFTTAADGSVWMAYHANLESGTGWAGRSARLQPVFWDGDMPVIGKAASPEEEFTLPCKN